MSKFTSEHRVMYETPKIDHFSVYCHRLYTKIIIMLFEYMQANNINIIPLEISGGGGCLPGHFAAQQKSTTIHLHLSK